jgi:phage terminase large subunit-like protein
MTSPIQAAAVYLHRHGVLGTVLSQLSPLERAALASRWIDGWARPNQIPPPTPWRSFGLCTGRGHGKTYAIARYVHGEATSGRAMRIALIAQNEDETKDVLVHGETGLISVAPPWDNPQWIGGRVIWPNGAQAFCYSPEAPGTLRGHQHHLGWASEVAAWPASRADEAFANLKLGLRIGYGRLVWDSTPKRRNPVIRELLRMGAALPDKHIVIRGSTYENRLNLTEGAVEAWEAEYGNTQRAREELMGEFLDDDEGALFRQAWIDASRRHMPERLERRIIAVDPSISTRKGTDRTGIVDLGLGVDSQIYVIADLSDKHDWTAWGGLVVERYVRNRCDCVVVERNRGGDAVVANLRACGRDRGLSVTVVQHDATTRHAPGTLYVKEVYARTGKESRAEPVASVYERGRVSHVIESDLSNLEDLLTTWEPGPGSASPDPYDALCWGVWELARLGRADRADGSQAVMGAAAMAKQLSGSSQKLTPISISAMIGRSGMGGRI